MRQMPGFKMLGMRRSGPRMVKRKELQLMEMHLQSC